MATKWRQNGDIDFTFTPYPSVILTSISIAPAGELSGNVSAWLRSHDHLCCSPLGPKTHRSNPSYANLSAGIHLCSRLLRKLVPTLFEYNGALPVACDCESQSIGDIPSSKGR